MCFAQELAGWDCRVAVATSSDLQRHQQCGLNISVDNLGRWLEAMRLLLVALKVAVSDKGRQEFLSWIAKEALYS